MEQVSAPKVSYHKFDYQGDAFSFALLFYKTLFLTFITFGIYYPWATTERRQYVWRHLTMNGDRTEYTGTGHELFIAWVKLFVILFLFGGFIHTALDLFGILGALLAGLFNIALYIFIVATSIYSGTRYKLSRTQWRSIRLGMDKNKALTKEFLLLCLKGYALTLVTLGFYFPYLKHQQLVFLVNKMRFGNRYFSYTGQAHELASIYYKGTFFSLITLGIYIPWFIKNLAEYRLSNTRFQGGSFRFSLRATDLLIYGVAAYLLSVATLGLATPFLIHWWLSLFINSLSFDGAVDFANIAQAPQDGNAFGDAMADSYDIDFGFF